MSRSTITPGIILNGQNSVAVARENDSVFRIQPLEVITEIKVNNFERNNVKEIVLSSFLEKDYTIIGVSADFVDDDDDLLEDGNRNPETLVAVVNLDVIGLDGSARKLAFWLNSYPSYVNRLFLNHNDTLRFKVSRALNSILFYCAPVILEKPINIP